MLAASLDMKPGVMNYKSPEFCFQSFEMWCQRRMEISCTDRVRHEEVSHTTKEEKNIPRTISKRKANWIDHIPPRICLLKHVIDGKREARIGVMGRRGRRGKQLLADFKENRGYCELKKEALDHTVWRGAFGTGYGPVGRLQNE
jgi:hypothetical protein